MSSENIYDQPVLGANVSIQTNDTVETISEFLKKKDVLSLSSTSKTALNFFKAKREKIIEEKRKELDKIETTGIEEFNNAVREINADEDNMDENKCLKYASLVFLGATGTLTALGSGFNWKHQETANPLAYISGGAFLIISLCCAAQNLYYCKGMFFAERKINRAQKAIADIEALEAEGKDETSILMPQEPNGNDNDNMSGNTSYGSINA